VDQAWRTLAMEPRFAPAQHALGLAYQQLGMLEEAMVEFQNALVCSANHPAAAAALGYVYALAGQRKEAEESLRQLEPRRVSRYWVALLHAGLGDHGSALKCLEQARDDRDVWLVWLGAEPRFDSLRSRGLLDNLLGSIRRGRRHFT
jgi:tetratricopeptide (TPR) repeat protein